MENAANLQRANQRKVFQALKEVQKATCAEAPILERSPPSRHIVAAMGR